MTRRERCRVRRRSRASVKIMSDPERGPASECGVAGRPEVGRRTARIAPSGQLRISYLIRPVVCRAGALGDWEAGVGVGLAGGLAGRRHASGVEVRSSAGWARGAWRVLDVG